MHFYLFPTLFFLAVCSFSILIVLEIIKILGRMQGKNLENSKAFNIIELIVLAIFFITLLSFAVGAAAVIFGLSTANLK